LSRGTWLKEKSIDKRNERGGGGGASLGNKKEGNEAAFKEKERREKDQRRVGGPSCLKRGRPNSTPSPIPVRTGDLRW